MLGKAWALSSSLMLSHHQRANKCSTTSPQGFRVPSVCKALGIQFVKKTGKVITLVLLNLVASVTASVRSNSWTKQLLNICKLPFLNTFYVSGRGHRPNALTQCSQAPCQVDTIILILQVRK